MNKPIAGDALNIADEVVTYLRDTRGFPIPLGVGAINGAANVLRARFTPKPPSRRSDSYYQGWRDGNAGKTLASFKGTRPEGQDLRDYIDGHRCGREILQSKQG